MVLTIELNIGRRGVGVRDSGNILHRKVASVIIMYGFLVPKEAVILRLRFNQRSQ